MILSALNQKEDSGKTTMAVDLAMVLVRREPVSC
jgi:hypothetical protein